MRGVPSEPLSSPDQRQLREAGFELGYPVYERNPNGSHVTELYKILHMITIHSPLDGVPTMSVSLWLPTASGRGEHDAVQMKVWEIRRYWYTTGSAYWCLKGLWHPKENKRCYVNKKCVYDWVIRLWIDEHDTGVVQFVPKGRRGAQILAPDGDDFRWGTRSSKALPPPYRR
jgi:hypothetical protein